MLETVASASGETGELLLPAATEPAGSTQIAYSVVVPVYRNSATLAEVVTRLTELALRRSEPLEIVFVVDGSPDDSAAVLKALAPSSRVPIQVVELSRNFGAFSAIRTGLSLARGRSIAVMAADLQEPVALIEDFFDLLDTGQHDVAVGVRREREDPALSSLMSRAFWGFYRRFVLTDIPAGGVDIFGCTAQVRDVLVRMRESHTSLVGLLFWLGFRRVEVAYARAPRADGGKSGWSFRRKLRYLFDSIFSFTDLPITALIGLGIFGSVLSVVIALFVFGFWAAGKVDVAGYTPLMLALLLFSSLMLLGLGIVGSYVWRAYENTKGRPGSIVRVDQSYDGTPSPL